MKEKEFVVRRAYTTEWETAMELVWRTFLRFEAPEYSEEGRNAFLEFISGDKLYQMFLIGEYPMWVALDGDKIVGVATIRTRKHISLLFVDEEYHRQGIGTLLVKSMQEYCLDGGDVKLTVNASPYGEPFYHSLGFLDTEPRKLTDGIIYTPMILLERI